MMQNCSITNITYISCTAKLTAFGNPGRGLRLKEELRSGLPLRLSNVSCGATEAELRMELSRPMSSRTIT